MVKFAYIDKVGGADVIKYSTFDIGRPKQEEVLVRHTVIGLNRYDLEQRTGARKVEKFPAIMGVEAVGVVEEVGPEAERGYNSAFKEGDRVGYCTAPHGAYCEKRVLNQKYLIKIPNDISDELAAAVLFKGMAAHYLLYRAYYCKENIFMLVHGAAGGIGQILCQWADYKKCKVIGTVSSNDKANLALENGCSYVINYNNKDFVKQIMQITKGKGVSVVYDPIGALTSNISFQSLGILGLYVSYGQISGVVKNLSLKMLASRSLFVTSTSIYHYKRPYFEMVLTALEIFEMLRKKYLTIKINKKYSFGQIKEAHRDMENRLLVGSNIIVV